MVTFFVYFLNIGNAHLPSIHFSGVTQKFLFPIQVHVAEKNRIFHRDLRDAQKILGHNVSTTSNIPKIVKLIRGRERLAKYSGKIFLE